MDREVDAQYLKFLPKGFIYQCDMEHIDGIEKSCWTHVGEYNEPLRCTDTIVVNDEHYIHYIIESINNMLTGRLWLIEKTKYGEIKAFLDVGNTDTIVHIRADIQPWLEEYSYHVDSTTHRKV